MRKLVSILLVWLALSCGAMAQDTALRRLDSGDDAKAWEAVGRLDINGTGFCTGALVAPTLVLTAAHCLYDRDTGERLSEGRVQFLAGWRNGRADAYRDVARVILHPDYVYQDNVSSTRVRNDLALLELSQPIRNTAIRPFRTTAQPRPGETVGIVSYAMDRSEAPSLQEVCDVLARQDGVLVTSCSVDFGSSGAPIFVFRDGEAQIVSVVSAKAEVHGKKVSLGTALGQPLAELQAELMAGHGISLSGTSAKARVRVGADRRDTGAKFVRP